jgi:hypothetical protein
LDMSLIGDWSSMESGVDFETGVFGASSTFRE